MNFSPGDRIYWDKQDGIYTVLSVHTYNLRIFGSGKIHVALKAHCHIIPKEAA